MGHFRAVCDGVFDAVEDTSRQGLGPPGGGDEFREMLVDEGRVFGGEDDSGCLGCHGGGFVGGHGFAAGAEEAREESMND